MISRKSGEAEMKIYFATPPCSKVAIKWVKMLVIKCAVIANTRKTCVHSEKIGELKAFFSSASFQIRSSQTSNRLDTQSGNTVGVQFLGILKWLWSNLSHRKVLLRSFVLWCKFRLGYLGWNFNISISQSHILLCHHLGNGIFSTLVKRLVQL